MTSLFISDLHLDEQRPDLTAALFSFLKDKAAFADELFILGDFFELWIGDDHSTPLSLSVIRALKEISNTTSLYFMHGNRDFLIGNQFAEETGCQILNDPYEYERYGFKCLLMHGDSLCTTDTDYMAFRQMVRNPEWQQTFLQKPIAERLLIANHMREQSKNATQSKAAMITDVSPTAVLDTLSQSSCDLLIHGHTHRPKIHSSQDSSQKRIVLGDWDKYGWVLELNDEGYHLGKFEIKQ